ncbi:hypothetical protein [Thermovibrio sp.]
MVLLNLLLKVNPKLNTEGKKVLTVASKGAPPFERLLFKEVLKFKDLEEVHSAGFQTRPKTAGKLFPLLLFKAHGVSVILSKVAERPKGRAVKRTVEKENPEFKKWERTKRDKRERVEELRVLENLEGLKEKSASAVVKSKKEGFTGKKANSREFKSTPTPPTPLSLTPKSSEKTFEKLKEAGSTENLTDEKGKEIRFHYSEKMVKVNKKAPSSLLKGAPRCRSHLPPSGETSEPLKRADKTLPSSGKGEKRKTLTFPPLAETEEIKESPAEKLFSLQKERKKSPLTAERKPEAPLKGGEFEFLGREFAAVKEGALLLKEAKQKIFPEGLPVEKGRPQVSAEVSEKIKEVKAPTVKPKKRKGKLLNFEVKEPSLKFRSSDFKEWDVKPSPESDSQSSYTPSSFTTEGVELNRKISVYHAQKPTTSFSLPSPSQEQSHSHDWKPSEGNGSGAPRHSAATSSNFHSFVVRNGEVLMRLSFNRAGFLNLTLHLPETFSAEPFLAQEIRTIIRSSGFTPGKVYLKVKGRGEVRERLTELRV